MKKVRCVVVAFEGFPFFRVFRSIAVLIEFMRRLPLYAL
jgi:hypothetical protein